MIEPTSKKTKSKNRASKLLMFSLSLVLCFGIFLACEGPMGSEGPQGPEGPAGPVGPAGENGSVMHAGNGAPSSDIGAIGDYYLDKDTAELYGPKNESGWGTPIALAGEDGEDGSQIFSDITVPDASLGQPGDFYLNTATFDLYGPKTESGWGTPINLKGTANVMYSSWTEFGTDTTWSDSTNEFGITYRKYWINAPQVDSTIIDEGVVLVYIDFIADIGIQPLPIVENIVGSLERLDFDYSFQEIELKLSDHPDGNTDPGTFTSGNFYRYVIIPGGTAIGSSKGKEPNYKNMPYEEVKKRLGIPN